jgi:electron transfer flavoprotein alpha subunit
VLAVLSVRDGALPAGGAEVAAECGDRSLLVGTGVVDAATVLTGTVRTVDAGAFRPATWAAAIAPLLVDEDVVVLPASADGRDLAPLLAARLGRPLYAGAVVVRMDAVVVARRGGRQMHSFTPVGPFVATLQPGSRGVEPDRVAPSVEPLATQLVDVPDPQVVDVLEPDAATMDLAEARRIIGGGAGLHGQERFEQLADIAGALGASVGATRVITDRGWVGHERQIGTTGVVVDPRLYLAFGISGAVQHTSGLGTPDHIVSVNTDAYCPMMQLADLAIVADANEVLAELHALLVAEPGTSASPGAGATAEVGASG